MPTAEWNQRWAKVPRRFKRRDEDGHWGDPTLSGLRYRWHPRPHAAGDLLHTNGFETVEHDRALLDHSNVVVIRKTA